MVTGPKDEGASVIIFLLIMILIVVVVGFVNIIGVLRKMRQELAELLANARTESSVVSSFIAWAVGHTQTVDEALDAEDLAAVREANDSLKANMANVAAVIAANTPASAEVPVEQGGTGDETTVVDTAAAVDAAGGDSSVLAEPIVPEGGQSGGDGTGGGTGGEGGGE